MGNMLIAISVVAISIVVSVLIIKYMRRKRRETLFGALSSDIGWRYIQLFSGLSDFLNSLNFDFDKKKIELVSSDIAYAAMSFDYRYIATDATPSEKFAFHEILAKVAVENRTLGALYMHPKNYDVIWELAVSFLDENASEKDKSINGGEIISRLFLSYDIDIGLYADQGDMWSGVKIIIDHYNPSTGGNV